MADPQVTARIRSAEMHLQGYGSSNYGAPASLPNSGRQLSRSNYSEPVDLSKALRRQQDMRHREELAKQIQLKQLETERKKLEDERYAKHLEEEHYDPYGKGGGGAPLKDKRGHAIADRRTLHKAAVRGVQADQLVTPRDQPQQQLPFNLSNHSLMSTNSSQSSLYNSLNYTPSSYLYSSTPNLYGSPQTSGTASPFSVLNASQSFQQKQRPKTEKEEWHEAIQQQIEEKKRLKDIEKQKEAEQDARDQRKFQEYHSRMMAEIAEEKEKVKKKQDLVDKRREKHEKASHEYEKTPRTNSTEWWERQGHFGERILPAPGRESSNQHGPSAFEPYQPRQFDTSSPPVRKKFEQRPAALRNEQALRQFSAMRERLHKEHRRVESALKRKDYNSSIFDDDNDVLTTMPDSILDQHSVLDDVDVDAQIARQTRRKKDPLFSQIYSDEGSVFPRANSTISSGKQRGGDYSPPEHRTRLPAVMKGSPYDHEPLIRMIKDSRTSLTSAHPPIAKAPREKPNEYTGKAPRYSIGDSDEDNPDKILDAYLAGRNAHA